MQSLAANLEDVNTMAEHSLARSHAMASTPWGVTTVPRHRNDTITPRTAAGATFLTECSFRVAQERLVQVITDVHPFEPHWEKLSSIDLSKRRLESVARMKEFLPKLDSLYLCVLSLAFFCSSVMCSSVNGGGMSSRPQIRGHECYGRDAGADIFLRVSCPCRNDNFLSWLTGISSTVRTLSVASNS
jgi:hypothetical protein